MVDWKRLFTPVESMNSEEAKQYMADHEEGSYTLLDVRQPQEYERDHIPGAKLIPLPVLNDDIDKIDPDKPVITYCAVGGRSRAAAQTLAGAGFKEVYNLSGGIKAWNGVTAEGPEGLNLDLVRGDETPVEMIRLAYALEMGLETFYAGLESRTSDPELRDFYTEMEKAEQGHKKWLFQLQRDMDGGSQDVEAFEGEIHGKMMEGGMDVESFMEKNEPYLKTTRDALSLALMIEGQSQDLYMRFADRLSDQASKTLLYKLAESEKFHLSILAQMLEDQI